MKTVFKTSFLLCLAVALSGCGITGRWTMQSLDPESAKKDLQLCCITLNADGTYQTCTHEGSQTKQIQGTYKYDASSKTLTLSPAQGQPQTYKAEPVELGCKLKIWDGEKGKEWVAMMKRAGACSKADCCQPAAKREPKACPQAKSKAAPGQPPQCPHAKPRGTESEPKKPVEPAKDAK